MSADGSAIRELLRVDRLLTPQQRAALVRAVALIEAEDRKADVTRETPVEKERGR